MATLRNGSRLGPYEILEPIGAGGMGEVFRARDTRLDRVVAIKVLAAGLSGDVASRERFQREARAISSLNHPNICVLFDVGRERPTVDGPAVDFLVMEYVEGETLSARMARGPSRASRSAGLSQAEAAPAATLPPGVMPSLTVEEALSVAIQICAALDRAHRQGIVHRDLKPGNVMLSRGTVKLLDFGLARLSQTGGNEVIGGGMLSVADLSMPTVSSPLTVKGTILGTLQYMAPEQLEGKAVDARADIFSFGGLLYEMLTGRRPFEGKSQASLIGAILDHQPAPVTTFQPVSPPLLDEVVARCLAKDPDERWQSARDLGRQLQWIASHLHDRAAPPIDDAAASNTAADRGRRSLLRGGTGLLASAVVAGAVVAWALWPQPPARRVVTRVALELPADQAFTRLGRHLLALSPDGERLIYVANQQLYLREMRNLATTPISGTEGVNPAEPIFSPDGEWVAFWANGELKKLPVGGGTPMTLGTAQTPFGGAWVGDRILLGQTTPRGIVEFPSAGGTPKLLVSVDEAKGELAHGPQLLNGGRALLFTLRTGLTAWDASAIVIQDLASGNRRVVVNSGTDGRVLPTGHLVYSRDATLFAMPFDAQRLMVTGGAVPIQEGIQQSSAGGQSGAAQMAWSEEGTFAFVPGSNTTATRALVWIDRQGKEELPQAPHRTYSAGGNSMQLSPDGSQLAIAIFGEVGARTAGGDVARVGTDSDIWVWHTTRGSLTRLTFTGKGFSPAWTADGRRICHDDGRDAFCQSADGSGQPELVFNSPGLDGIRAITADGKRMLFTTNVKGDFSLLMATMGPPTEVRPLFQSRFSESTAALSPDGRWLAYSSDESGRNEVYVRPFPSVEQSRSQVSTDGGTEPRWARNGRELFFTVGGSASNPPTIMAASVEAGTTFAAGRPAVVLKMPNTSGFAYAVGVDGRFLINRNASAAREPLPRPHIVMVQHWFDELTARMRPNSPAQ